MNDTSRVTDNIRQSCQYVMQNASHVSINEEEIKDFAKTLTTTRLDSVAWDSSGWHYCADASLLGPLTCQYVFVLDSLNFCFWPQDGLEYEHLAVFLKNALDKDPTAFDASKMAHITEAEMLEWFQGKSFPNMIERVRVIRELGQVLVADFEGLAANMVRLAAGSAAKLINLIIQYLPGENILKHAYVYERLVVRIS